MQKRDELKNRLEELFSEDSVDFNGNGGTHKEDARKDPFPKPLISETTPTGHEEKEYKTALATTGELDIDLDRTLLRTIIDSTPDWIFIKDREHRYRMVNQGYANALHIKSEDFIGKNDLELGFPEELVKGDPKQGIRGFWPDDQLVMDSRETQTYPNDPATIDGEVHIFHTIKTPLINEHNEVWGVLAFSRDITEHEKFLEQSKLIYEQMQATLSQTERLYVASNQIIRAANAEEILLALVEATPIRKFDQVSILLADKNWDESPPEVFKLIAVWDDKGKQSVVPGSTFLRGQIPWGSLTQRDFSTFVLDASSDYRLNPEHQDQLANLGIHSLAIFPLMSGDQWLGVIFMQSSQQVAMTADQVRQIESLVGQAAMVLQGQKLQQDTQERLRQLNALQRANSREAWASYLNTYQTDYLGYLYDRVAIEPIDKDMLPSLVSGTAHTGGDIAASQIAPYMTPLTVHGEPIGSLGVVDNVQLELSQEDETFLNSVAEQVAQALERARLIEQTQKNAIELQTVAEVSTVAATILDPEELLQSSVDLAKNSFGLYHAHIYLLDDDERALVLKAGAGQVGRTMVQQGWSIPIEKEDSIVTRAFKTREGTIINDVVNEKGYLTNPLLPDTIAEMALPMIVGQNVIGVFDVQSDRASGFTQEDERIFTTLSTQIAIALQNARLFAEQIATVERLRELDSLKSSFLANMSHELRTPLNSILGFTQVMEEGLDGPLTENMSTDLQLIEKNGKHLLNLINYILDMAKIEAGRMSLVPELLNLTDLVREVMETNGSLIRDKGLYLNLERNTQEDIFITGDQVRLRQVIINIIGNASKFTEAGGVSVHLEKMIDRVQLRVHDTGIGIPANKLESIFEAFSQVDTTTTRKVGGTGLGLPISRRLVELHGGHLWAESTGTTGQGSTFIIELPLDPETKLIRKVSK